MHTEDIQMVRNDPQDTNITRIIQIPQSAIENLSADKSIIENDISQLSNELKNFISYMIDENTKMKARIKILENPKSVWEANSKGGI